MIRTRLAMWWTWTRIAVREVAEAVRARHDGAPAWEIESAESAALSKEFETSLTAISACAFAMEALSKDLEEAGHRLDKSKYQVIGKVTSGFHIGHQLIQAFNLKGPIALTLPSRLDHLYGLRNNGVHFESKWLEGIHPHPSGTNTSYELTVYTMEEALVAVNTVYHILEAIRASSTSNLHDPSVDHIIREIPGVIQMLKKIIKDEGLSGYLDGEANG